MVSEIVGRFASVDSDSYKEYGLESGNLVFIAGSGFSPVDDEDNYKLLFVVTKVTDGKPSMDKGVTMARSSLKLLDDESNNKLKQEMEEALAQQEETKQDSAG